MTQANTFAWSGGATCVQDDGDVIVLGLIPWSQRYRRLNIFQPGVIRRLGCLIDGVKSDELGIEFLGYFGVHQMKKIFADKDHLW